MSKDNMKIGIVCPYDYFRHGGVQEHIRAVSHELRQRGHEVKIITPLPPDKDNKDPEHVITLGRSTLLNAPSTSFELSVSALPAEIDEMLEREQFDIINYHEPSIPMLSSQILSRSTAINVATQHARMPDTLMNKPIEMIAMLYSRNSNKNFDHITAVSEAAAYHVRKVTDREISIVPNGISLDRYDPEKTAKYKEFDDDKKTILYVGRLEKRKGVEYLLKAYHDLRETRSDVRLVICGEGPKRTELEEYVDRYDLPDVHFPGFISEEDKLSLLKTCSVFSSPALFGESFGIVLIEALAMGAPIVCGDNPGYVSVMQETGRISIVKPKDTLNFALRLELLLYDEGLREYYRSWAKKYIKQFDYKVVTDKYEAIYKKLLDEKQEA